MAIYDPGTWFATVSWRNSGELNVQTEVYFGGPFGAPPASGSLTFQGTAVKGVSSMDISLGSSPAPGIYYAQVRHVKTGSTPSDLAPAAPIGGNVFA